jgi:tight adherence protein B
MRRALVLFAAVVLLAFPLAANAAAPLAIRHVDLGKFPLVRVTAIAPAGSRPALSENGRPAAYVKARELGSAEALVLALDNSESMQGAPLAEAKRAAGGFLADENGAGSTGLVVFGHEALALTRSGEQAADVARTLASIAPDTQTGTSLYDAVVTSVTRLQAMPGAARILVLLTDGHDVGSTASLSAAIARAQRANVVVYAIAAGRRADRGPLTTLARATGGRVFDAANLTQLARTYDTLRRELDRTWQISYLTAARPGDEVRLGVRVSHSRSAKTLRIPGTQKATSVLPARFAHSRYAVVVVALLTGLLIAVAVGAGGSRRRRTEISRLLEPHLTKPSQEEEPRARGLNLDSLVAWTERSIADLPGSQRLERAVERSGLGVRLGHVPFLAVVAAFFLGIVATIVGAGPGIALLLMLVGLAVPFGALKVAAQRRTKAFDRQLPDVLATVASTLRAGHGLRTAMRAVADDGSPPASQEFTRVLGEERLGRALDEAIAAMCERVGSADLEYVATAINVQSQTGGSLASLFDTLSETVRERQRHARRVRALTSMGRMSATVLICLPFGLATLMTLIDPRYMAPLFTKTAGHVLIGVCVTSMGLGALILRRIVNVRY